MPLIIKVQTNSDAAFIKALRLGRRCRSQAALPARSARGPGTFDFDKECRAASQKNVARVALQRFALALSLRLEGTHLLIELGNSNLQLIISGIILLSLQITNALQVTRGRIRPRFSDTLGRFEVKTALIRRDGVVVRIERTHRGNHFLLGRRIAVRQWLARRLG